MARKKLSQDLLKIYKRLYESLGSQYWWPGDTLFEVMVGAILTQNTNWRNVSAAIDNVKRAQLLDPKKMLKHRRKIQNLIKPSGFYKLKSKRLNAFLEYFVNNYKGKVENMKKRKTEVLRTELLRLPGIGFETADSMLLYALSRPVFVVDAYTRRIFSRHHIFKYELAYDDIRNIFEKNLPRRVRIYNEYHALLVKIGKEYCKKNEPLCSTCPLNNI
jgi:endonuclease-3 related protein